jgi:RsiW-degrading membrane proteinase PrsW (M82 family)
VSTVEYARRVNGLPKPPADLPWAQRLLRSPWTWVTIAATLLYAYCLVDQYYLITQDIAVPGGTVQGINFAAVRQAALYAAPTLAFWVVVYLLADRFRPQRPLLWYLSLGWGAAVAIFLSMYINTWAASHLGIAGDGDPATATRAAVFIAPFVEEACKATVLFWLAVLVRYRLVSKVSMVVLAGLSAAGFACVENIVYYARAIFYASREINVGDAQAAIDQTVMMRGVFTCFGHPLFTTMTGLGVAVALRAHSKVVRVLAPLTGYLFAAFGHMLFNSQASMNQPPGLYIMYWTIAVPMFLAVVVYVVRSEFVNGRLIRARLGDYVQMGWLHPSDPEVFSRLRKRFAAGWIALGRGLACWLDTMRLQRAMTELAFLRDAEARGLVDAADQRAEELLVTIRDLRSGAISDPRGLKFFRRRTPRRNRVYVPVGRQAGYSSVDPNWGPPS